MLNEVTRPGSNPAGSSASPGCGSLLVVDDDTAFLSPLCEFLSESGFRVRGCTSAGEALEALKEQKFDLLLTDLVMPEMDGILLMRAALETDPRIVGIIITGQATIQTAVEAMKIGAFDYLVKPLDFKMLMPLLSRALYVRRLRIENVRLRETVEVLRLKQALQESETLYRAIFENTGTAMVILEEDTTISLMNSEFEKLCGYSREESEGKKSWREFVADCDRERMERYHYARRNDPDSAPGQCEFRFKNRPGDIRDVVLTVYMIPGTDKSIASLLDITERKRAEEKARSYQEELRALVSALPLIEERERRRIAGDLHDSIGQTLALSKIKLGSLSELVTSEACREVVEELRELVEQSILYTRSLTSELSPPLLYELGFEAAVESLAEQLQKTHGVRIDVQDDGRPKPLDDGIRIVLYKAVRELLINVVKHARAQRAHISMCRDGDLIRIALIDDGVGFRVSMNEPRCKGTGVGFGLFNIRERIESINGCLEIRSDTGHGTRVAITAPLRQKGQETP